MDGRQARLLGALGTSTAMGALARGPSPQSGPKLRRGCCVSAQGGWRPPWGASRYWQKFASDPEWYPGKRLENAKRRGPKVKFTPLKKRAVANGAMALKAQGIEPTVAQVVARAPTASQNPATGTAFSERSILNVFRTCCYDVRPDDPWVHESPHKKTALSGDAQAARLRWATRIRRMKLAPAWFRRNVVWIDPCSSIIPKTPRAAFDQEQASKGSSKRWMSKGSKARSRNLRAPPYAGRQAQWGDLRMWWFMVLTRGKIRLHIMGDQHTWRQNGEGMSVFVEQLPAILTEMLGDAAPKPRVIFSDRGPGLYNTGTGIIVHAYRNALTKHGLRSWAGDDATWQPPDVPDVLLHETVVGWVRKYFQKHPRTWRAEQEVNVRSFRVALQQCETCPGCPSLGVCPA